MLPIEAAEYYEVGGFHPINIDDTLNDRYRVVNKLGRGANSTVWLVEDLHSKRFASLKVLSADSSLRSSEVSVSRHLQLRQEQQVSHPGRQHVVNIFDTFTIQGPNGTHHCIVTEILGLTLKAEVEYLYGEDTEHFPPEVAKKVAAQVAHGVAYLHRCGIVHGDPHMGNVLFYSPKLQNASPTELNRIYGEPIIRPIQSWEHHDKPVSPSVHRPTMVVYSGHQLPPLLEICLSSPDNVHIKICDFGESFIYNPPSQLHKPFDFNMPLRYRAPEILFNDIVSPAPSTDIWALGVLYMIINEKHSPFITDSIDKDEVIQWMVMILGKLPDKWWVRWAARAKYFNKNGVHRRTNKMVPVKKLRSIRDNVNNSFSGAEIEAFRTIYSSWLESAQEKEQRYKGKGG
ncbi:kinase-like domain-containing protein [Cyathus striatus]|nr:kinase-like domain-containing protein [Cyathus striatus]